MESYPFTIKHVTLEGHISIFPAKNAFVVPLGSQDIPRGSDPLPDKVEFSGHDDVRSSLDAGTVYIMNAQGKTVQSVHIPISRGLE